MEKIIEKFYRCFQQLDAEGMVACYDDDVVFEDPAFGKLEGEKAKNMWRMLCNSQKGKDFKVIYADITSDNLSGSANWEAQYTFSKTGRKVHNIVKASFVLNGNKISQHTDSFNLHRWAKQAFGMKGILIGGTGFFKKKLNAQTNYLLEKYEETI